MKLRKLSNGRYSLHFFGVTIEGTGEFVMQHMKQELGVDPYEVDYTVAMMLAHGHDTAELGDGGTFLYTHSAGPADSVILELEAIRNLRQEFHRLASVDAKAPATRDAWDRLMNLYMGFNAEAALELLKPERLHAA
jgi:hypothetical protein